MISIIVVTGRLVDGWVDLFINVILYDGKKERRKIRERAIAARYEEQQSDHVYYANVEIDWFNFNETVEDYLYSEFSDLGYLPTYEFLYIDEASFIEDNRTSSSVR